jgi:hypothetical protein
VPPGLAKTLNRLLVRTSGALALVSGRSLNDIDLIFACPCRKSNPNTLVVWPAESWATKYASGPFDGARDRRVLSPRIDACVTHYNISGKTFDPLRCLSAGRNETDRY